jgi:hypothetical protein
MSKDQDIAALVAEAETRTRERDQLRAVHGHIAGEHARLFEVAIVRKRLCLEAAQRLRDLDNCPTPGTCRCRSDVLDLVARLEDAAK